MGKQVRNRNALQLLLILLAIALAGCSGRREKPETPASTAPIDVAIANCLRATGQTSVDENDIKRAKASFLKLGAELQAERHESAELRELDDHNLWMADCVERQGISLPRIAALADLEVRQRQEEAAVDREKRRRDFQALVVNASRLPRNDVICPQGTLGWRIPDPDPELQNRHDANCMTSDALPSDWCGELQARIDAQWRAVREARGRCEHAPYDEQHFCSRDFSPYEAKDFGCLVNDGPAMDISVGFNTFCCATDPR